MKFDRLVSRYYKSLNQTDRDILEYVYDNKKMIPYMGIEELAKECLVSRSTIMRFAQKLGLNGYTELRTVLKWDLSVQKEADRNIVDTISDNNIEIINSFRKTNCDAICEELFYAKRIFVYGTGNIQKAASNEFKRIFLSFGIIVDHISGEGELLKTIKLINNQDVIFILSQRGESSTVKSVCDYLNAKGVKIISLTFSANNYLANHSDHKIYLEYEEITIHNNSTIKSVTMMFTIIELLCAKFISYLLELEDKLKKEEIPLI